MSVKELFHKYKHFSTLLIYALTGIIFGLCEKYITETNVIYSRLDDYIPFVKEMVVPYVFWYVYIAGAILYLGLKSKPDYHKLIAFLTSSMLVGIIFFIVHPSEQQLRPVIVETDIFSRTIAYLYSIDTPTNVLPSLHVVISIAVHAGLVCSEPLKDNKLVKFLSTVCMVIISISTVFVKQHSIIDVFWGVVVGIAIYLAIYKVPSLLFWRKSVETQ
jgi:membrane-associated phospholipid phosphatase